jgi:hypothetical protein
MKKNNIVCSKKIKDDECDFTKEEKENIDKWKEVIEDYQKKPKTDLLEKIKFDNQFDTEIFERLPLSLEQKEVLLIDILSKEYPNDTVIQEYKKQIIDRHDEELKNEL